MPIIMILIKNSINISLKYLDSRYLLTQVKCVNSKSIKHVNLGWIILVVLSSFIHFTQVLRYKRLFNDRKKSYGPNKCWFDIKTFLQNEDFNPLTTEKSLRIEKKMKISFGAILPYTIVEFHKKINFLGQNSLIYQQQLKKWKIENFRKILIFSLNFQVSQ